MMAKLLSAAISIPQHLIKTGHHMWTSLPFRLHCLCIQAMLQERKEKRNK